MKTKEGFSRFAHEFHRNGTVALYHSVKQEVLYLPKREYKEVKKSVEKKESNENTEILKEKGFLISKENEDSLLLEKVLGRFIKEEPKIKILYLLLTDICNLRCSYCFIEESMPLNHSFSKMTEETMIKGLNLFCEALGKESKQCKKNPPKIIFYGGEPLLNKAVFLRALEEIQKKKDEKLLQEETEVLLLTNATVIDGDILEAIKKYKVSVSVSLDGPKEVHDESRPFVGGEGSFSKTMGGIRRLREEGISVAVSCTINSSNLDNLESSFEWIVEECGLKGMGFNILHDLPERKQADEVYAEKASKKIINCYKIAREKGIYEDRIMRKVKSFVSKTPHIKDCAGYGNQMVVAPDGEIGPCHAYIDSKKFFTKTVDSSIEELISDSSLNEWNKRTPFNMQQCYDCEALAICGGGCARNADIAHKDIWGLDDAFCIHSKKTLEWLIWDLFDKISEGGDENDSFGGS